MLTLASSQHSSKTVFWWTKVHGGQAGRYQQQSATVTAHMSSNYSISRTGLAISERALTGAWPHQLTSSRHVRPTHTYPRHIHKQAGNENPKEKKYFGENCRVPYTGGGAAQCSKQRWRDRLTFTPISAGKSLYFHCHHHGDRLHTVVDSSSLLLTLITKVEAYFSCDKCFRIRISFLMGSLVTL